MVEMASEKLSGALVASYRRAIVAIMLVLMLDSTVSLLALLLTVTAFQSGNMLQLVVWVLLLLVTGQSVNKRSRELQLAMRGPAVDVYTDGVVVNLRRESKSLRWGEIAGVVSHKFGNFGRVDIKLVGTDERIKVFFVQQPDRLGQQLSELRKANGAPPAHTPPL